MHSNSQLISELKNEIDILKQELAASKQLIVTKDKQLTGLLDQAAECNILLKKQAAQNAKLMGLE